MMILLALLGCTGNGLNDSVNVLDMDNDGFIAEFVGGIDCDDADSTIHPHAEDIPDDGIDQDCDGYFESTTFVVSVGCNEQYCKYAIATPTEAETVFVDIHRTGDSDLYDEYHDEFFLAGTRADDSALYWMYLECVTDIADVGPGTTLTCPSTVQDGLTWVYAARYYDGDYDCVVTGDDPSYYGSFCVNVQ